MSNNQTELEFAPTVQLSSGKVRGLVQPVEDGKLNYFYQGIRYGL